MPFYDCREVPEPQSSCKKVEKRQPVVGSVRGGGGGFETQRTLMAVWEFAWGKNLQQHQKGEQLVRAAPATRPPMPGCSSLRCLYLMQWNASAGPHQLPDLGVATPFPINLFPAGPR